MQPSRRRWLPGWLRSREGWSPWPSAAGAGARMPARIHETVAGLEAWLRQGGWERALDGTGQRPSQTAEKRSKRHSAEPKELLSGGSGPKGLDAPRGQVFEEIVSGVQPHAREKGTHAVPQKGMSHGPGETKRAVTR